MSESESSGAQSTQVAIALLTATVRTHLGDGANNPGTIHTQIGALSAQITALRKQLSGEDGAIGLAHRMQVLESSVEATSRSVKNLARVVSGDDGEPGMRHQIQSLHGTLSDIAKVRERLIDGVGGRPSYETRLDRIEVQAEKAAKIQMALMAAVLGGIVKFILDAVAK